MLAAETGSQAELQLEKVREATGSNVFGKSE